MKLMLMSVCNSVAQIWDARMVLYAKIHLAVIGKFSCIVRGVYMNDISYHHFIVVNVCLDLLEYIVRNDQ